VGLITYVARTLYFILRNVGIDVDETVLGSFLLTFQISTSLPSPWN
jgi:hypothetical protein